MKNQAPRIGRKTFLRTVGSSVGVAALGATSKSTEPEPRLLRPAIRAKAGSPNVLVIMSDQHRADYANGLERFGIETPGFTRLAAEGLQFDEAHCSFPLCCPSRTSFLTGRMPSSIYCNDNRVQLDSDMPTVAHGFAAGGYETVLAGRMHIIGTDQRHGFSQRLLPDVPGTAFFNAGWGNPPPLGPLMDQMGAKWNSVAGAGPGRCAFHDFDEEVTRKTVDWLETWAGQKQSSRRPFFLVAGFMMPHPPFVAREDDYAFVASKIREQHLAPGPEGTLHPLYQKKAHEYERAEVTIAARLRTQRAYTANCLHVDRLVGNILDALDRLALNEDTLVVYVSDHGEQMGAHGLWGKSTFFRESTRVPLLMRWPGQLESGQRVTQPVSLVDLGSTLLQLAGLETLPNAHSEGFGDLITSASKNNPEAPVIIEGFFGDVPGRTVVTSRWRFSCYLNQGEELFDLRSDPTETRNLSGNPAYASIQAELARIAASGWNPEDLQARMKMRMKELSLLQSWVGTTPLKEPDPPWHQGRQLRNYVRV